MKVNFYSLIQKEESIPLSRLFVLSKQWSHGILKKQEESAEKDVVEALIFNAMLSQKESAHLTLE